MLPCARPSIEPRIHIEITSIFVHLMLLSVIKLCCTFGTWWSVLWVQFRFLLLEMTNTVILWWNIWHNLEFNIAHGKLDDHLPYHSKTTRRLFVFAFGLLTKLIVCAALEVMIYYAGSVIDWPITTQNASLRITSSALSGNVKSALSGSLSSMHCLKEMLYAVWMKDKKFRW